MEEKHTKILEWTVLIVILIVVCVFFIQIKNQDINLCRCVLSGLVQGNYAVEKYIDWENLKALGLDVGQVYTQLPSEKERVNYKKAFIQNFSSGFKQTKGRLKSFTHWRVYNKNSEKVIIMADYLGYNKTILFILPKYGRKKIMVIQWRG